MSPFHSSFLSSAAVMSRRICAASALVTVTIEGVDILKAGETSACGRCVRTRRTFDACVSVCAVEHEILGLGLARQVEIGSVQERRVDDHPAARISVISLHARVGPDHAGMGTIDVCVVFVVHVLVENAGSVLVL